MKNKKVIAAILLVAIVMTVLPCTAFAKAGEYVTVGGFAVGIELDVDGVAIVGVSDTASKEFAIGDVITGVNGERIGSVAELRRAINGKSGSFSVTVVRNGETQTLTIKKNASGNFGITVRDQLRGVGTVTYVRSDGTFASLGHPVGTTKGKSPLRISGGKVSSAVVIGVNKGEKGRAGELKAVFVERGNTSGKVLSNTSFGVYGILDNAVSNPVYNKKVMIASRDEVKLGKATILATVDGTELKEYAVEIVSKASQKNPEEKGLVIKVVDKELLEKTGGIVQGMSGSPIMQDGKLVGAVTHVFLNDSTRGYGIYAEFMG